MILYRYLDYYGGLKTLESSSLKATRPMDYNDPFEYLVASDVDRRTYRKEFLSEISTTDMDILVTQQLSREGINKATSKERRQAELTVKQRMRKGFEVEFQRGIAERTHHRLELLSKNMAVICFSANPKNNLMWGHYCNGHRGVILEFDTKVGFQVEPTIIEIKYRPKPPSSNFLNGNFKHVTKAMQLDLQRKILGYKSDIWKYEAEHRIQFNMSVLQSASDNEGEEILTFEIPKAAIKSITFGCRLSRKKIDRLCQILDQEGYEHVSQKYALPSIREYSLEYVDREAWLVRQSERERIREEYIREPL
jgi:hypothetical protein